MSVTASVPVAITPEAAAHVAQLGYQREFEEMLEHTLKTVPHVRRVDVYLEPDEDLGFPKVMIQPTLDRSANALEDRAWWKWSSWAAETYPGQVLIHFLLWTVYEEAEHGR